MPYATAHDGTRLYYEETGLFNQMLGDFLGQVDSGRWRPRDPRSVVK